MLNNKPVILVTSEQCNSSALMGSVPIFILEKSYTSDICAAGGIPITPLAPCMEEEYCEMADALLLTGGSNIHPGRYKTPFSTSNHAVSYHRDNMEFDLFQAFFKAGKPIMGIGRGQQLINVALGGTLMQDLTKQKCLTHDTGDTQQIKAEPGSILEKLYGESFFVNTYHNQAVEALGEGMKITASGPDGIPEALEHESKPIFSVQFRPEILVGEEAALLGTPDMLSLFQHLISLCG
jgi:Predicted glutamine amidotransferases